MIILFGLGIFIGIIVLYLLIITFAPGFSVPKQPLGKGNHVTKKEAAKPPKSRKDVSFEVKGTKIKRLMGTVLDILTIYECL